MVRFVGQHQPAALAERPGFHRVFVQRLHHRDGDQFALGPGPAADHAGLDAHQGANHFPPLPRQFGRMDQDQRPLTTAPDQLQADDGLARTRRRLDDALLGKQRTGNRAPLVRPERDASQSRKSRRRRRPAIVNAPPQLRERLEQIGDIPTGENQPAIVFPVDLDLTVDEPGRFPEPEGGLVFRVGEGVVMDTPGADFLRRIGEAKH